ncbi:hypothetical protein MEX01_51610 [Methylorubrum extorquens]|uniref:hypothetical protein n=1 Tax=Methylorubrum extorquens TaxID=408 RepID=UPI0011722A84|nr:hypothetical protein [Methylorubrum extorquens]GEL44570.1 hypothetical protein MEX01_51610 [Methylorubrum extorquens]
MAGKQPASLDGLIQTKGAPRPSEMPQRGEAASAPSPSPASTPAPAPASAQPVQAAPASISRGASDAEPRTKSLTLRLSEARYQRLRRYAFERDASHQEVIEAALIAYLDKEGG